MKLELKRNHQAGAVLVVSLIFLLVLTIVGVAAMQNTTLEEKMAGNVKDRNLAFQNAESAIREAETFIDTVAGVEGSLNLPGYGDNKGGGDVTIFNITARGTGGGADSAEVILRSYYGRVF